MIDNTKIDLDIQANRRSRKWSRAQVAGRALWEYGGAPLFSLIPRPAWGLRRALLRAFGARIGADCHIYPSVRIAVPWNLDIGARAAVGDRAILYCLGSITIGEAATISQGAHLCAGTHDHRCADMPLVKSPIVIGAGAWVCADAFIGPNVHVGRMAIIGARAVAMKDVGDDEIVAGNPARRIGTRELTIKK